MADINEELKKIRKAEEEVSRMIKEENEKSLAKIEDAKKKAEEILKNAEKELESIKLNLENDYNSMIEKEISKLKKEWDEKMKRLEKISIEKEYVEDLAKSILEEK
jgi:hypothetical protein